MNAQLKRKAQESVQQVLRLENSPQWKLDTKDPNPVYTMEIGDDLVVKGVTNLPHTVEQVVTFINTMENSRTYDHHLETAKVLQQDGNDTVAYYQYESMFPVSGRDFVAVFTTQNVSANRVVIAGTSVNELPENSDYVRGHIHLVGFIIDRVDARSSRVTYLSHSDMRGSLPGFIKNKVNASVGERPSNLATAMKQAGCA